MKEWCNGPSFFWNGVEDGSSQHFWGGRLEWKAGLPKKLGWYPSLVITCYQAIHLSYPNVRATLISVELPIPPQVVRISFEDLSNF